MISESLSELCKYMVSSGGVILAHLEEEDQEDETKRTGVVDSSSDRSRATE